MTGAAEYAIGTLLTWIGVCLSAVALFGWARLLLVRPRLGAAPVLIHLLLAGLSLLVGSLLLPRGGLRLPLIWPVMPFTAWAALACAFGATYWCVQSLLASSKYWRTVAWWMIAAAVFGALYWATPDVHLQLLRGAIPLSPSAAGGLALLAGAAALAMVGAESALKRKRALKGLATQCALVVGSLVFGLPLFWLILTSFKEERDMASDTGLVWVPRVQETVPFFDPKKPLLEASYEGQVVSGYALDTTDSAVLLDVQKPQGMRGYTVSVKRSSVRVIPTDAAVVTGRMSGMPFRGIVVEEMEDGRRRVKAISPRSLEGAVAVFLPGNLEPVRRIGLRLANYSEALDFLPPEAERGLAYLRNTLVLVVMNVIGTLLASSLVAYAFARLRFPGKNALFVVLLSTMMLPGAVTLMPQFLIFRSLGWVDTLLPLWVPAFFGSAFNIFLLRQFFSGIPLELEDAARIDGCGYLRSFWKVMLPQIKPALAVIAIWTFMGAWNNFMGPLIYVNSPEHMPISYAVQMYSSDRAGEPGLLMAFTTMSLVPVLLLFFFAQRYFIEGVTLTGLGGR